MGGDGSGSWTRYDRKTTVEECLSLSVGDFPSLLPGTSGTVHWACPAEAKEVAAISFRMDQQRDGLCLTLHYCQGNCESVDVVVRLQATPTHFAGWRSWFICPLIVDGEPCNRRVGKLYLPPRARYFGCRHCHALTYRSCQVAHYQESIYRRLFPDANLPTLARSAAVLKAWQ